MGKLNQSSDCTYTVDNELITKNSDVELEFRTVSTDSSTAFLDKTNSTIRTKIGSNLSLESIRKEVLDNRNDSYNKTNEGPIYTITLTPTIIEDIREYNKSTSYDDYEFICKNNGQDCISNYLTCLDKDNILEINTTNKRSKFRQNEMICE